MRAERQHFLIALAFTSASLAAIHSGTFGWLTTFVYHGNIRDYVPAGITSMTVFFLALVILQVPLVIAGRRRRHVMRYLLGGLFGVPVAVVLSNVYSSAVIALLRYSLQKDIAVVSFGAALFTAIAIVVHRRYLSKKSDNKSLDETAANSPLDKVGAEFVAAGLEKLLALPLVTDEDEDRWGQECASFEKALESRFPAFELNHEVWHFFTDIDIRRKDVGYREWQHRAISDYIRKLRSDD